MLEFIQTADESILAFFRENVCNEILDKIMLFITTVAEGGIIWIALGLLMFIFPKYRKHGVKMELALLIMICINNFVLKTSIARPRPYTEDASILEHLIIAPLSDFSFPSGHAASSFAGALILARANSKFAFWAYPLATLIAVSRIYLQVHYPSDVIAGALLGTIYALLGILAFALVEKLFGNTKAFNVIFK